MMTVVPPALIVAYKRNQNVIDLVETLVLAGVSRIYVAIDGPKDIDFSSSATELSSRLRRLKSVESIHLNIWERKSNLGPAVSVITAIDWFFANEESGIILEDDLKITTDSVRFFADALMSFKTNTSVGIISGSNFWGSQPGGPEWASFPITWGWATWKDRWSELRNVFFSADPSFSKVGKLNERYFWWVGLRRCLSGEQDAWDIPFASYFRSLNKICVFPPVNLISNIGVDVFAGNTREKKWPLFHPVSGHIQLDHSLFTEEFDQKYCLDSLILRQIYRVSNRNILSGFFFSVTQRLSPSRFSRQESLSFRVKKTELP